MNTNIKLSEKKREEMIGMIEEYFEVEHKEAIGNMKAMLLLDFIIKKIAPEFYNVGIEDAHVYLSMKIDDIFELQK